ILLYFNVFQIALGLYRPQYRVKGILFKQFYRMNKNDGYLKYYRKFFQTWFFTLNKKISSIFVLNDSLTADFLNKQFNTKIFKMLPDPIPELAALENFNIYEEYSIGPHKKVFL